MPISGGETGTNFSDFVNKKYGSDRYEPRILLSMDKIQGGLCVIPKHHSAERHFETLIKKKAVSQSSLAIVEGTLKKPDGKVIGGVIRTAKNRARYSLVKKGGTPVEMTYCTLAQDTTGNSTKSLLCFNNITYHRHQIRFCCSSLEVSIIGDSLYKMRNKNQIPENDPESKKNRNGGVLVSESDIPFYCSYLFFQKYLSREYYEIFLPPTPSLYWTSEFCKITVDDARKIFTMTDLPLITCK